MARTRLAGHFSDSETEHSLRNDLAYSTRPSPDAALRRVPSQRSLHGRKRLALFDAFRDSFTPVCKAFSDSITGMSTEDIRNELRPWHDRTLHPQLDYDRKRYHGFRLSTISRPYPGHYLLEDDNGKVVVYQKVPVGAYGKRFSMDLIKTADVLLKIGVRRFSGILNEMVLMNPELFAKLDLSGNSVETFRGGIRATVAAVSLLMVDAVGRYDDPGELLERVLEASLPKWLSLRLPFGIIEPLVNSGRYIPGILECDFEGKIMLSREFGEAARKLRDAAFKSGHYIGNGDRAVGLGCPVGRSSGVDDVCTALLHAYRAVRDNN